MQQEIQTKKNVKQAVPFFAVSNIEESLRYYVDGLGFEMTQKWIVDGKIRWCWLQQGGAALMLQEFPKEGHDSWTPEAKVGEGVSICFICEDALAVYRAVRARGIEASKPIVGNGMWVSYCPTRTAMSFILRATRTCLRGQNTPNINNDGATWKIHVGLRALILAFCYRTLFVPHLRGEDSGIRDDLDQQWFFAFRPSHFAF